MPSKRKIIAIIVTYNRSKLLVRCLNKIKSQTLPPKEILVINNGSTDNTSEVLKSMDIKVINQENVGSAGGWERGIDYAIKNNFDAAWLMDDDGFPDKLSLEVLENSLSKKISCVSSIVVKENDIERFVFPYPILNKNNRPSIFSLPRKIKSKKELLKKSKNFTYPFVHLFNGALISIEAIRKIGNINKNYFIYGDEIDYLYRLLKVGDVISNVNAIHYHPDVTNRPYNHMKIYFLLKNTLIINKKYLDKVFIRNIAQIINILLIVLRRNGINYFLRLFSGKNCKLVPLAIYRGFKGKIGNDYNL